MVDQNFLSRWILFTFKQTHVQAYYGQARVPHRLIVVKILFIHICIISGGGAEHSRQDAGGKGLHTEYYLPCGSVHDLALYGDYFNNICAITEDQIQFV